jgi:hypothetical protein
MPRYTIETVRHLPSHRHRTYRADTVAEACRCAIEDKDWSGEMVDHDRTGEVFVSGIWKVADIASAGTPIPIPSQYGETIQRQAAHFEILHGLLKMFLADVRAGKTSSDRWIERAISAVARAEAIMAGARDPVEPAGQHRAAPEEE